MPLVLAGFQSEDLVRAYLQKDSNNIWQAGTADWTLLSNEPLAVRWIDWGDNLESVDWYTKSQVRTEVVLFQDLPMRIRQGTAGDMLEYEMRHVSGWGIDEVHGLAYARGEAAGPILGPGTRATVYSHCARLTIQKLLVSRDEVEPGQLVWQPGLGWTEAPGAAFANWSTIPSSTCQYTQAGMVPATTRLRSMSRAASSTATPGMCANSIDGS